MLSKRGFHNKKHGDVSNGFRGHRVCHGDKVFELRVPHSRNSYFYPGTYIQCITNRSN